MTFATDNLNVSFRNHVNNTVLLVNSHFPLSFFANFVLLFFVYGTYLQAQEEKHVPDFNNFEDSLYYLYAPKEFLKLERVNKEVDFEHPDNAILNAAVFHLTNLERTKRKRHPLEFSIALVKAAQFHSEQMRDRNFFNHKNKKSVRFFSPIMRATYFGYSSRYVGENIVKVPALHYMIVKSWEMGLWYIHREKQVKTSSYTYYELAKKMVELWMGSPRHRKNIMHENHVYLGCGVALPAKPGKRRKSIYALGTQNFGGR